MTRAAAARLLAAAALCLIAVFAAAQPVQRGTAAESAQLERLEREADVSRDVLEDADASNQALREMRARLEAARRAIERIAQSREAQIEPIARQLGALAPPPENEAAESAEGSELRDRLNRELGDAQARLNRAQALAARYGALLDALTELQRERVRTNLLTRGPSPLDPRVWITAAADVEELTAGVAAEVRAAAASPERRREALRRLPDAALAAVAALALIVVARRSMIEAARRRATEPGASRATLSAIGLGLAVSRVALPAAALGLAGFAAQSGIAGPEIEAVLEALAIAAAYVILAYALSGAYFAPEAPELRLAEFGDKEARAARRAAMRLVVALGLAEAVAYVVDDLRLPPEILAVANFALVLLASEALLKIRRVYAARARRERVEPDAGARGGDQPDDDDDEGALPLAMRLGAVLRLLIGAAALAAPALAAVGYLNASHLVMTGTIRSAGVLGLCAVIHGVVCLFARSLEERRGEPSRTARAIPIVSGVVLTILAEPLLALAWGWTVDDLLFALGRLSEGFAIGGVTIAPLEILTFVGVFVAGFAMTRLAQRILRGAVLPELGVAPSTRNSLTAVVGYAGVGLAGLIAISVAGLDLSNLAIVAGALSVGVGFGLQAIVNNFVSGIILLAERPVKTGDWIDVGGVHGYVKRINVRSTEIETFDRSTYIVPNSTLITAPVTNYTHRNPVGRLIVKVRVAFDADLRKVEAILREAATAQPLMIKRPEPLILFRAFGASAFEFEIRGFLKDVNYVFNVGSDIHFFVAERFREEGIRIPFDQRELWFRNVSEVADALRAPPEPPLEAAPTPLRSAPGRAL